MEDIKNQWIDKFQGIDYGIEAMTDLSEWAWFDPIRKDTRFEVQLERLKIKRAELEKHFELYINKNDINL